MNDCITRYVETRYKRKKQLYRIKLGCSRLISYPILLTTIIIEIATVFYIIKNDTLLAYLSISNTIRPLFNYCVILLTIITAVLVILTILFGIGEIIARKDEGNISLAFDKKDLKSGYPILIYKKYIKKKGVIVREFYTTLPMEKWLDKKETLADILSEHFLIDFEYGGKNNDNGNRIILKSAKGRKNKDRGILYDENF